MDLPPNWTVAPAAELLFHDIGGVWGKEPGVDEVDVSVVRVADFRDTGSISLDSAPLRSITRKQLDSRRLVPGDILLEKSGGGPNKPVGRVARVQGESGPVVPTNFAQLLRPDGRLVDSAFLFWWLWYSHLSGHSAAFQRATTNIRNLQTQDYLGRAIPLPPLNEQRRIVAAIEEHLSRLDAADAYLAASSKRLSGLRAASLHAALRGEWPTRSLGDIALTVRNGIFVSRPAALPPGVPIFRISAVRPMALDVEDIRYAEVEPSQAEPFLTREDDLLFTRYSGNPEYVGACARIPRMNEPTLHPDKLIRVVIDTSQAEPAFVELACSAGASREAIRSRRKTTAGQVGIAGGQLRTVPVPLPPLDEQRRIVARVEEQLSAIDALRAAVERAQRRSASLRRAVLKRAFRGELVPHDPTDEPASVLLERIREERAAAPPSSRRRRVRA